jgi:hypothetical protein
MLIVLLASIGRLAGMLVPSPGRGKEQAKDWNWYRPAHE